MDEFTKNKLELEIIELNRNIKLHKAISRDVTEEVNRLAECHAELYDLLFADYDSDIENLAT